MMHAPELFRQVKHEIWIHSESRKIAAVPRHTDVKRNTVKQICQSLEIPVPF